MSETRSIGTGATAGREVRAVEGERKVNVALVQETMSLLVMADRAALPASRKIGTLLFEGYFGGDEELVRSKDPTKGLSWEALTKQAEAETTWDDVKLRRAMLAEIVIRGLPDGLWREIPPTYLWMLFSIVDPKVREALARKIVNGDLVGDKAKEAILKAAGGNVHGGRPKTPSLKKVVSGLEGAWKRAKDANTFTPAHLGELDDDGRLDAAERLRKLAGAMTAIADKLEKPRS